MAENKDEQLTDEELAQLQLAEENENAVARLVKELGCPTRRIRQFAARVLHLLAERDPQRVVPCVPALIEALVVCGVELPTTEGMSLTKSATL